MCQVFAYLLRDIRVITTERPWSHDFSRRERNPGKLRPTVARVIRFYGIPSNSSIFHGHRRRNSLCLPLLSVCPLKFRIFNFSRFWSRALARRTRTWSCTRIPLPKVLRARRRGLSTRTIRDPDCISSNISNGTARRSKFGNAAFVRNYRDFSLTEK